MDFEQALETQRHRLLRIIAGLVVLVGCLAVGPVSRGFSEWILGFVRSILSGAETASRYLLIAQASSLAARSGQGIAPSQIAASVHLVSAMAEADCSLSGCQRRLKALRLLLSDLPNRALRLLRRIAKEIRRSADQRSPRIVIGLFTPLRSWRRAAIRVERPPDKVDATSLFVLPPSEPQSGGVGA